MSLNYDIDMEMAFQHKVTVACEDASFFACTMTH